MPPAGAGTTGSTPIGLSSGKRVSWSRRVVMGLDPGEGLLGSLTHDHCRCNERTSGF